MNESLIKLYELQKIDTAIDDLVSSRGELPYRVAGMRDELVAREADLVGIREHIALLDKDLRKIEGESEDSKTKLERYKAQQFDVKTTREYDAISFQIEDADSRIRRNEDSIVRMGMELENVRSDEKVLSEELEAVRVEFAEAESALKEIEEETAGEESRLKTERVSVLAQVDANHLAMYERIRPAKDGLAVVSMRSGSCGGCYNAIPRQLALELKLGEKLTVCESCGRIILSDAISLLVDGEPVAVSYEMDEEEAE